MSAPGVKTSIESRLATAADRPPPPSPKLTLSPAKSPDGGGRSPQNLQAAIEVRVRDISLGLNLRWQDGYRSRRLAGVDVAQRLSRLMGALGASSRSVIWSWVSESQTAWACV